MASEPRDLARFVDAQRGVYEQACAELRAGQKRSHWMWLIFPQIHGLGSSPTAVKYAISSLAEATAYLADPALGPRLREATELVLGVQGRSVSDIFGYPDDLKFHSSITLFAQAAEGDSPFREALNRLFDGVPDKATLVRL